MMGVCYRALPLKRKDHPTTETDFSMQQQERALKRADEQDGVFFFIAELKYLSVNPAQDTEVKTSVCM